MPNNLENAVILASHLLVTFTKMDCVWALRFVSSTSRTYIITQGWKISKIWQHSCRLSYYHKCNFFIHKSLGTRLGQFKFYLKLSTYISLYIFDLISIKSKDAPVSLKKFLSSDTYDTFLTRLCSHYKVPKLKNMNIYKNPQIFSDNVKRMILTNWWMNKSITCKWNNLSRRPPPRPSESLNAPALCLRNSKPNCVACKIGVSSIFWRLKH